MAAKIARGKIIGVREYTFESSTKEQVRMVQLFCIYDDERTKGDACCATNMTAEKAKKAGLDIGSPVNLIYFDKKWQYVDM